MPDLDDFLKETVQRLEENKRTRDIARQDEEEQRKLFLRSFRDIAQNTILPVLVRVKEKRTPLFDVKVDDYPEQVGFEVTMNNRLGHQIKRGLKFSADYQQKRIVISFGIDHTHSTGPTLQPQEITQHQVEELVKESINRTH